MAPEPNLAQNFSLGPYLSAAFICRMTLEEKDGVISAIRIVDRVIRGVQAQDAPAVMVPFEYEFTICVMLKTGEHPGNFKITIQPIKPSNERLPSLSYNMHLESPGDRGGNLVAKTKMLFDMDGLWWFDILMNDVLVTRIPFRIIYLPQQG